MDLMLALQRLRGTRFWLAAVPIIFMAAPGCTWLINPPSNTSSLANASKQFDIPQATHELAACMNSRPTKTDPTSFCPANPAKGTVHLTPLDSGFDESWVKNAPLEKGLIGFEQAATDERTVTALKATAVLNHPVQRSIDNLFNLMSGLTPAPIRSAKPATPGSEITIPLDQLDDYLSKLQDATATGSWNALAVVAARSSAVPADKSRLAAYIATYMAAYFRHGKFFEAKLDASAYKTQLIGKLTSGAGGFSAKDAQSIADQLFDELGLKDGTITIGSISTDGFTSRGGQALVFPELQVTVSVPGGKVERPQMNYTLVGDDILRVLLNAIFDAWLGVPATSGATGATVKVDDGSGNAVDVGLVSFAPEEFSTAQHQHNIVTADEFASIDARASQVDAASASAIGRVVRGGGFISLNNEALASMIETVVGVTLRKGTEKVLWCWYACAAQSNVNNEQARADYHPLAPIKDSGVIVSVTGRESFTRLQGTAK
jgi:hypothetical protein